MSFAAFHRWWKPGTRALIQSMGWGIWEISNSSYGNDYKLINFIIHWTEVIFAFYPNLFIHNCFIAAAGKTAKQMIPWAAGCTMHNAHANHGYIWQVTVLCRDTIGYYVNMIFIVDHILICILYWLRSTCLYFTRNRSANCCMAELEKNGIFQRCPCPADMTPFDRDIHKS